MPSAINADNVGIPPGFAVTVSQDRGKLASSSVMATAMVTSGAPPLGILSLSATGVMELSNWSLATGSQFLIQGATYYVQDNGKIAPSIGGQSVGFALSPTELQINIATNRSPYTVINPGPDQDRGTVITTGQGPPTQVAAQPGDFYFDTNARAFYGPYSKDAGFGKPAMLVT